MRSLSRHVMQAKSRLAWVFFIISGEFNFLPTCTDLLTKVFWNQSVDVFKGSHSNDMKANIAADPLSKLKMKRLGV